MKYYIQLEGDGKYFRLQKDYSWRLLDNKNFEEEDLLTSKIDELVKIQEVNSEIDLNGKKWKLNPTSASLFGEGILNYSVYTKRDSKPTIPSKDQLIETIGNGDDTKTNCLILNTDGFYSLLNLEDVDLPYEYPNIVVRNEAFIAGNEYVGEKAANDMELIDDLYNESLECWLINLEKGKTNMFSDGMFLNRELQEVIDEIEALGI